jgi:hypothetical protein
VKRVNLGIILAALVALAVSTTPASAQIADVSGPGQSVPKPGLQCPQTIACTYEERGQLSGGYRFQAMTICGANCTTQYWVTATSDGRSLIEVPPTRGGGLIAVARPADDGSPPAVRTILPGYGPNDPACCPTSFVETTYTWDAGQGTLVAGEPVSTPTGDGDAWAASHDKLAQDGFFEIFGGP